MRGRELLELLDNNRDDPKYDNRPLQELMRLDRHHPAYPKNLLDLAIKYHPSGKLHDNLEVLYILNRQRGVTNRRQIDAQVESLEECIRKFSGKDAGALACFELAKLYQALGPARMEKKLTDRAVELYGRLIEQYPGSLFANQAQQNLSRLKLHQ